MTRERTARATYAAIEALALEAFEKHKLTPSSTDNTWTLRNPESVFYGFAVHFEPGMVVLWGDLGEFVLRHSDRDSLTWLLDCGRGNGPDDRAFDGGEYCDYLLSKVRASEGDRREFMIDDAHRFLDDWETEIKNECVDDDEPMPHAEFETSHARNMRVQLDHIAEARQALKDVQYDHPCEQSRAWHEVMSEIGYDDPPRCDGWSPQMLWLWQCVKLFRRLSHARPREHAGDQSLAQVG